MAVIPDFTLPTRQSFMMLLNEYTTEPLDENKVELQSPALNPNAETDGKNTVITLVGIKAGGFHGTKTVKYNRISLTEYIQGLDLKIPSVVEDTDLHTILDSVNTTYGLALTEEEVVNRTVLYTDTDVILELYPGNLLFQDNDPVSIGITPVEYLNVLGDGDDQAITDGSEDNDVIGTGNF